MSISTFLKRRFSGVSWQSPVAVRLLPAIDAADRIARRRRGLSDEPDYSIRIRGTGMSAEFGGTKYLRTGSDRVDDLIRYARLDADSRVLDIGCGAGRAAFSLARKLGDNGRYAGLDVDAVSIGACQANPRLRRAGFTFTHADLETDLYNTGGSADASTYRLPFADGSFDIVYLESVFTHLTTAECVNYAAEILRVLDVGGRAVVSTFLRDLGTGNSAFTFQHRVGDVWVEYADNPRKAVAAETAVFDGWFGRPFTRRLRGDWRGRDADFSNGQDWMVYTR